MNPGDVAFDEEKDQLYIAETDNKCRSLLIFTNASKGGKIIPTFNLPLKAISSVHFHEN